MSDKFNPFSKKGAGLKKPAQKEPSAALVSELVAAAEAKAEVAPEVAPAKLDVSKLDAKEAKAFIVEQFKAKQPVFVIAKHDGEHPRAGSWKKQGQKFKLEFPEAYSHRWMKLA